MYVKMEQDTFASFVSFGREGTGGDIVYAPTTTVPYYRFAAIVEGAVE